MVIHKGDEQHVGKGKKHRCEHIAVYILQLHHLSEDSSEEEGGVGGEECHHHRHDDSCPVAGGEFYQPAVQYRERIEEEWEHGVAILRVIHLPLREGKVGVGVET